MAKQTITLHDVEIPEGYAATGEYRRPSIGEQFLNGRGELATQGHYESIFIILRRKEPTHIKALRHLIQWRDELPLNHATAFVGPMSAALHLAAQSLAEWEASNK